MLTDGMRIYARSLPAERRHAAGGRGRRCGPGDPGPGLGPGPGAAAIIPPPPGPIAEQLRWPPCGRQGTTADWRRYLPSPGRGAGPQDFQPTAGDPGVGSPSLGTSGIVAPGASGSRWTPITLELDTAHCQPGIRTCWSRRATMGRTTPGTIWVLRRRAASPAAIQRAHHRPCGGLGFPASCWWGILGKLVRGKCRRCEGTPPPGRRTAAGRPWPPTRPVPVRLGAGGTGLCGYHSIAALELLGGGGASGRDVMCPC